MLGSVERVKRRRVVKRRSAQIESVDWALEMMRDFDDDDDGGGGGEGELIVVVVDLCCGNNTKRRLMLLVVFSSVVDFGGFDIVEE